MDNKAYYIKFQNDQPVGVDTHIDAQLQRRVLPLAVVGDLVKAFLLIPGSPLANTYPGRISIHVPVGLASLEFSHDWFDEGSDTLRSNLPLDRLTLLGQDYKLPLVIKTESTVSHGIYFLRSCRLRIW